MINFLNHKNRKGFTLPEIIAGALIVTISAAGTYSAYILARRFAERFKHRTLSMDRAVQIADRLRYRFAYNNAAPDPLAIGHYDSTSDPANLLNVGAWPVLHREVDDLDAVYDVSYVWFIDNPASPGTQTIETNVDPDNDGDADPTTGLPPAFKRIVVSITWDERE